MGTVLDDVVEQEFRFLILNNYPLRLYVSPSLFMPNQTTAAIASAVNVNEKEVGIELGAGTAPLTILLASRPLEHLHSTEIVEEQCELARRNLEKYDLMSKVTLYHGSIFDPIRENHPELKADFIVSDISGIAEEPGRSLRWYPKNIPTGGPDGTDKIIPLIEQAPQFLKESGRLYFPVAVHFSDHNKILQSAKTYFNKLELLSTTRIPLTKELIATIDALSSGFYESIERKGSRGYWHLEVYKATLPRKETLTFSECL